MALADDLLEQARHLAHRERQRPRQASLRRALSAAYYSVFHLLIADAVANWRRDDQRDNLARAFEHGKMKDASKHCAGKTFPGADPADTRALKEVAKAFVELQAKRQSADYDNSIAWSRREVLVQIDAADRLFRNWRAIRNSKIAQDYLFSFLVRDRT